MAHDDRPIYLRIRDTIAAAILDGEHGAGDPLPSVRTLAAEHGANPLTVAKAYQGLQEDGLVIVRRGVGMFVASGAAERLRASDRAAFLAEEWPLIRAKIDRLGLDPAALLGLTPA